MQAGNLELFVESLYGSGVVSPGQIDSLLDEVPRRAGSASPQDLAGEMVRRGIVTSFQAEALLQGKARGLLLGNYMLLDRLGRRNRSRVYRSLHKRMKRVVALKVLSPHSMKSAASIERFQREVEATARLSHPNIVAALDAGEDKGVRFLAMEFVDGHDLGARVGHLGAMPVAAAVDCLLQAARGLEYAHWHGIVHLDVKPENLMLDWRGTIKLLDLGIAAPVPGIWEPGPNGSLVDAMDRRGVLGTPHYAPPEQAAGSKELGPPCDVYSLGCTLYYLLVGKPVFPQSTVEAAIQSHRDQPVPSLRAVRPDVPRPLDKLFQRMLAKRPEDRPATMAEVIAELDRIARALRHRATWWKFFQSRRYFGGPAGG